MRTRTTKPTRGKRQAFSFVEVMIGMIMGLIVMMAMLSIGEHGFALFTRTEQVTEAHQSALIISQTIEQDLSLLVMPELDDQDEPVTDPPGLIEDSDIKVDKYMPPFKWQREDKNPLVLGTQLEPMHLKDTDKKFSFYTSEWHETDKEYKLAKITYSLKKYAVNQQFEYFKFTREFESGSKKLKREYSFRIKDIIFDLRKTPVDPANKDYEKNKDYNYYLHLWVIGASSSLKYRFHSGSPEARKKKRDFQRVLCLRTVALDPINERLRKATGAQYWRSMRGDKANGKLFRNYLSAP